MSFKMDLTPRERNRYAKMLDTLSEEAGKAAEAMRNVDDQNFLISFILFSLTGPAFMKEMKPILEESAEVAKLNQSMKEL